MRAEADALAQTMHYPHARVLSADETGLKVAAPAFHFLEQTRTSTALYGVVALLGMLQSTAVGACYAGVTGALPKRTRSAALAIIYAIAVSVFGGSAQFVVAWLTALTQNPLAPAFYMSGVIVIGVAAMLAMPMPRHQRGAR